MAGVSLKCGDCGALLRSVEEAQEHAELTSHSNFSESTEAVLNLVCSTCGKPCRSKTVLYSPIPTLDCCTLYSRIRFLGFSFGGLDLQCNLNFVVIQWDRNVILCLGLVTWKTLAEERNWFVLIVKSFDYLDFREWVKCRLADPLTFKLGHDLCDSDSKFWKNLILLKLGLLHNARFCWSGKKV